LQPYPLYSTQILINPRGVPEHDAVEGNPEEKRRPAGHGADTATVADAIRAMDQYKVGSRDGPECRRVAGGIFTERDVLNCAPRVGPISPKCRFGPA